MTTTSPDGGGWSITLHSSWTGLGLNGLGAVVVSTISWYLVNQAGLNAVTGAIMLIAAATALIVTFDMPIATTFDALGVERRALLRRHRISWIRISRLSRGRAGIVRSRKATVSGGLVAWVGRRPYVLTDVMESRIEFDQLRDHLGHDRADALGFGDRIRPAGPRSPTWSYRRRNWRPDN